MIARSLRSLGETILRLLKTLLRPVHQFTEFVKTTIPKTRKWLEQEQPGDINTRPRRKLTNLSVVVFLGFCVFAAVAIAKPKKTVVLACVIPYGVIYICFVACAGFDNIRSKS